MKKIKIVFMMVMLTLIFTSCISYNTSFATAVSVISATETETTTVGKEPEVLQNNKLSMSINFGYEKFIKYGRNMLVDIEVTNSGKDFLGKVQVILPDQQYESIMYEKEISVASNSTKSITLAIPVTSNSNKINYRLINEKNKVVLSKEARANVNSNYMQNSYIGILSDDYNSVKYLSSDKSIYTMGTIPVKSFEMNNESFPWDLAGLDMLDVIVINDYSTNQLNESQYKALKAWVNNGGSLVLGTGQSYQKVLELFSDDFISGTIGELKQMEISLGENKRINKEILDIKINNEKELENYNGISLMSQITIGKGNVIIIKYDLGLNSSDWNKVGSLIGQSIYNNLSEFKINQLTQELNGGYSQNNWRLQQVISNTWIKSIPNIKLYAIILAIYTVIVGPIAYMILKKMDKRNLLWGIVPCTATVFSAIILIIGSSTRIEKPMVSYGTFTTIINGTASEEIYIGIRAPYNKKYSLEFDNKFNPKITSNNNYYYSNSMNGEKSLNKYNIAIKQKVDKTEIEINDLPAFSDSYYKLQNNYEFEGNVKTQLTYTPVGVKGTVTNNLGYDLEKAFVLANGTLFDLGEFKNGDTIDVEKLRKENIGKTQDLEYTSQIIGELSANTNSQGKSSGLTSEELNYNNVRFNALVYFLSEINNNYQDNACIIGYNKEIKGNSFSEGLDVISNGINLVCAVSNINYMDTTHEYIPDLDKYISAYMGSFDQMNNLFYDDTFELIYSMPKNYEILEIYLKNQDYYMFSFDGKIEFYNYELSNYEEVFSQEDIIKEPKKYLGENNEIKARLSKKISVNDKSATPLPVFSATKEAN